MKDSYDKRYAPMCDYPEVFDEEPRPKLGLTLIVLLLVSTLLVSLIMLVFQTPSNSIEEFLATPFEGDEENSGDSDDIDIDEWVGYSYIVFRNIEAATDVEDTQDVEAATVPEETWNVEMECSDND